MKQQYSKGEIAKIILGVVAVSALAVTLMVAPGWAYIFKLFDAKTYEEKKRIKQSLDRLKRNKCVKIYTKNGKQFIELTGKGYRQIYETKLKDLRIPEAKKWDGFWRIVIFDIPENRKVARNSINRKLKELGFYPLQKSTFIYPHECKKELDFLGDYYKIRKYIQYIKAHEVERSKIIKKHFDLK